jgi:hypothetical protein
VIVGLPDAAVKESRGRVMTALIDSGFNFTFGRTTINLAPADVKKEGPGERQAGDGDRRRRRPQSADVILNPPAPGKLAERPSRGSGVFFFASGRRSRTKPVRR